MVSQADMDNVRRQIEALRDQLAEADEVYDACNQLLRQTDRMLGSEQDGPYAPRLATISRLLAAVRLNLSQQQRMRRAYDQLHPKQDDP